MKHSPIWHIRRLQKSLGRQYREWRLPRGYLRLGTKYGGWWIDRHALTPQPLLVDCGLGVDISFPAAFLERFGGSVIGIDPNPRAVSYCEANKPAGMQVWSRAFWREAGQSAHLHDLIDDLGGVELALEAAVARGAERALHGAARLRRDAVRDAVAVRDEDALDVAGAEPARPEEFPRPVARLLAIGGLQGMEDESLLEHAAQRPRQVAHVREGERSPLVDPLADLPPAVGRLARGRDDLLAELVDLGRGEIEDERRSEGRLRALSTRPSGAALSCWLAGDRRGLSHRSRPRP